MTTAGPFFWISDLDLRSFFLVAIVSRVYKLARYSATKFQENSSWVGNNIYTALVLSVTGIAKTRGIVNNYSPKWRWLVVDIYQATKRRGEYISLFNDTKDLGE